MIKPTLSFALTASMAVLTAAPCLAQEASPAPEFDNFTPARTRAEVIAETRDAARRGLIAHNEIGEPWFLCQDLAPIRSRAQVRAETAKAVRMNLAYVGESGMPAPTTDQLHRIRQAGPCAGSDAGCPASP